MSATRILVLGLLAVRGPMHGHQLRRVAEMINIEAWGDVKVGALYGAIHRLEAEGLIHPIRSEQEGRFPARTVYAVTDEGRRELAILRSRALQEARLAPDPFDVALTFVDAALEEVEPLLAQRRAGLSAQLASLVSERERLEAHGHLAKLNGLVFRHGEARLRAEIAYLDEIALELPAALNERDDDHAARITAASLDGDASSGDLPPLPAGAVVPLDKTRRGTGRGLGAEEGRPMPESMSESMPDSTLIPANGRRPTADAPVEVPVLIVGGGPVGLTTALLLARQGVRTILVERHPGTSIHPRARGINVRTMEIFRSLGLETAIRKAGEALAGSRYMLWVETLAGAELRRVTSDDLHRQRERTDAVSPTDWASCAQDDLEPILLAELRRLGGDVRFGVTCEAISQDAEGVTATLVDRQTGQKSTVRAQYLVAADGGRSRIRVILGIGMHGPGVLTRNVSIYFKADLVAQTQDRQFILCFVEHPAVRGLITSVNQSDRWILNVPEDAALGTTVADTTPERCIELIRTATFLPDLPVEILSVLPWEARAEVADRFQDGRVFLAGDAAHLMPPAGAFGMNTGLQDAHNLAWKLAAVVKGAAGPGLLATYDEERRPVSALTVQNAVRAGAELFTHRRAGRNLSSTAGRPGVAAPADAPAPVVDDLAVMLGYWYASSAVVDSPGDTVLEAPSEAASLAGLARTGLTLDGRPGTRVPHVWLDAEGGRRSTLDLFADQFGVLADPDGAGWLDALQAAASARGLTVKGHAVGSDAASAMGIGEGGALLVRPDGFVGWRSAPGEAPSPDRLGTILDRLLDRS